MESKSNGGLDLQIQAFCRCYNERLAEVFEQVSQFYDEATLMSGQLDEALKRESMNALADWYEEPLADLGGQTPQAFLDALPEEALLPCFDRMACDIDEELPEYFKIRILPLSAKLRPAFEERALRHAFDSPSEEGGVNEGFLIQKAALKLLGEWEDIDLAKEIGDRLLVCETANEFLADALKSFYLAYGRSGLEDLLDLGERMLAELDVKCNAWLDYVLIYLVDLSRDEHDDRVYTMLKQAFRQMTQKIIPCICLGDYGDRRAVTLLRSYLEQHDKEVDRQLYYELLSSIKRLGGETRDLPDPFGDFKRRH